MRRLPFAFTHIEMVRSGRTAPINGFSGVAVFEMTELPESLARAAAVAAMDAVGYRVGDTLRRDQQ